MFRNLLSVYWPSIPSHDMENHVLFGQLGPFWMTGDMLGCPYFMFVVHIHFLFFEDYLGRYWSWTTIMDREYLLLVTQELAIC